MVLFKLRFFLLSTSYGCKVENPTKFSIHIGFHVQAIMKIPSKFLLSAASSLLFVCPAFSQTPQKYAFDNFDTATGVHIQVAEKPAPKPTKRGRRFSARMASTDVPFVKKTDLAIQPVPTSVKTASIKNLDGFTTGDVRI